MKKLDLKWEQNEVEIEEEEVGGLQVGSSKAIKEVMNGKIETNGHDNSTPKMVNGTEKSDLGDEQERLEVYFSNSNNGVEVEEETEPKELFVQKIVDSNNGVEEETEVKQELKLHHVIYTDGVEVVTEPIRESVQQILASNNGVEEVTEPVLESVQQLVALNNGAEEVTKPIQESVQLFVASNNGVEEGTELIQESFQQTLALNNGVEEETEQIEESVQKIVPSNNGVEELTEPIEESIQQILTYTDGVEEVTEPKEESVQHIVDSNNGVEEVTEPKEVSIQQIVALNNGVEEETEPIEESVQNIVDSNNGVEEVTEPKEVSIQRIVALNNAVEEETEPIEESVQIIVASNNGVEEVTEPVQESIQQIVPSNNGVEEGIEPKEELVQQFVASNNWVEEGTEPKEESIQQIVASNNGVGERLEVKKESKQHLVTYTDGVEKGTEAEEGPFRSGHSIYYDKDEDSNFISTPSIKEKIDTIPGDGEVQETATLDIQLNGYLKSDNLSNSSTQLSKDLSEDHSIVHKSTAIDEIESADADLINDSDTNVKDFDVENVLQKQNTHDLYCPNCKSCITRRVILRKRKRKIRVSGDDVKRNKLEVIVDSKVDASHAQAADDEVRDVASSSLNGAPPLAADEYQLDREPEIFRCLSCFSFFIPAGNGFKMFRFFGEKGNKENVKSEQTPTLNKKWYSSIFASDKGKASVEQGSGIGAIAASGVLMPSDNFKNQSVKSLVIKESASPAYSSSEITQEAGGKILGSKIQDANMKGKMVMNTVGKSENAIKSREGGSVFDIFDVENQIQSDASGSSKEVQGNDRNDELLKTTGRIQVINGNHVQDSVPASQQNDLKLLITSTKEESFTIEKPETDLKSNVAILTKGPDNESLLSSATTAFALNGLNGNGKPKILTQIPQEHEQHIKVMLPSLSPVANNENKFQLSSKGGCVFDIFEVENQIQPDTSAFSKEVQGNDRNDEVLKNIGRIQVSNGNLVQDSVSASQQNELKLLITSTKEESFTIEKSETDLKSDVEILTKGPDNESLLSSATTAFALNGLDGNGKSNFLTQIPQEHEQHIEAMLPSESPVANNDNKFQLSSKDGAHHYEVSQHTITKTNIEIHSNQPLKVDEHALISSVKDALSIQDKPDNITNISVEAAANSIAGNDTIITVESGDETTETASANVDTQIHLVEGQGTDAAEAYKIEIIKSIIFGGLAESLTSLSVITSATGGDASTLNILVLAMANLIGGLFIIFHNLWELKRDRFEQASNQIMEKYVDRYQEQLGRRQNFTLHAVLVVISYIIFGLVPPVIYGFSFRKSDDKELKIVAVAAASLVCILMLATGKAYVQKAPKPYFKTISAYIILGFTVSGVSYAAGILFKRLLEKLGLFQPSSPVNLLLSEMPGTGATWASL